MRIKRIELIGFKSFCDRTVLNFSEPITAVVGPNGCGKSNIVDAIRWCMGEQSAKHLRGKAMDDVIFAGSESRGPASMAEVSLTFEEVGFSAATLELALSGKDSAPSGEPAEVEAAEVEPAEASDTSEAEPTASQEVHELLSDRPAAIDFAQYSEVTVTRRLFRDGTSLYMINKSPCRLRDVRDFFLGTGVGTNAYSMIEQGRIGVIVSARPQDRRALIDEAAGITKFKSKKRLAERKLEQTRQNLLRVSDIVAELAKRMGSLKRQAQKAKRYRSYRNEVRDIELWKATHEYLQMEAEEKVLRGGLETKLSERERVRSVFETQDAAVIAERAELSVEERRLAGLQEALYELENRIKLSESKVEYQTREADELDERVASAHGEIKSLRDRRDEGSATLEQQKVELSELDQSIGAQQQSLEERDQAVAEARVILAESQKQLDAARGELAEARADMARTESQTAALARRREESAQRLDRIVGDTAEANGRIKTLESEMKDVTGGLSGLRQTHLDLGEQKTTMASRLGTLTERSQECEAEVETLRTEVHRRKSRLQSLIEIHDKYEGFARGTRAVMQNGEQLFGEADSTHMFGLVADVVQAPQQLEVAVEAALGDRLGGILVDSHVTGARAIGYLKAESAGRSAFVPSAPVGAMSAGIDVEDRTAESIGDGQGVLGRMVDLVNFEPGFDRVGKSLFGDALVVENLERALELHESGVERTLVTLDGDVVEAGGVVTGGSRDAQGAGVLAQKREIRELEDITESLSRDLADATARLVSTKTELGQVSKALESLRTETHTGEIAITGHEKDLQRCQSELERLRARVASLNAEQLELEERLRGVDTEEQEVAELRRSAVERVERFEREQLRLAEKVSDMQVELEALSQHATEQKILMAQLGEKRASVAAATAQLELAERELSDRIVRLEGSIEEGVTRAAMLREESAALSAELVALRGDHKEHSETLAQGRLQYEIRVGELQIAEMQVRELRVQADHLAGEVQSLELALHNVGMNRRVLEGSIEDRYQLVLRNHLGDFHLRPMVTEENEKRLTELRRLIQRMGSDINLTAIEEYQEVSERHEFLSTQQADLENAVEQLERAIGKINRTSRKLFRDTFDAINGQFQQVFPRLFRGGRALLKLTQQDGQDLLDCGVEIIAQPPGKKNTTVDQLSGGEKALTAVALIFSIFLIKPSPFCLLDEVDAPLDDANVDRYNEIVREMTDRSQFIVITHNKRTMEIADHLYGVTMQEAGVSKLVSVNLSRIGDKVAA